MSGVFWLFRAAVGSFPFKQRQCYGIEPTDVGVGWDWG